MKRLKTNFNGPAFSGNSFCICCCALFSLVAVVGCLPFVDSDKTEDGGEFPVNPCDENTPEWVKLPGGYFTMGSNEGDDDEEPIRTVHVVPFEIMLFEVTVAQYSQCVLDNVCPDREAHCAIYDNYAWSHSPEQPMNCIDYQHAADFCEWIGGRLPSEAEWEYAASSGGREKLYPWGDEEPTPEHGLWYLNPYDDGSPEGTSPVCSYPEGRTSWGLYDMAGNVAEWVADSYHFSYEGAPDDGTAWIDDEFDLHHDKGVRRGGGYNSYTNDTRVTAREPFTPLSSIDSSGFRCVR